MVKDVNRVAYPCGEWLNDWHPCNPLCGEDGVICESVKEEATKVGGRGVGDKAVEELGTKVKRECLWRVENEISQAPGRCGLEGQTSAGYPDDGPGSLDAQSLTAHCQSYVTTAELRLYICLTMLPQLHKLCSVENRLTEIRKKDGTQITIRRLNKGEDKERNWKNVKKGKEIKKIKKQIKEGTQIEKKRYDESERNKRTKTNVQRNVQTKVGRKGHVFALT